MSVYFCIVCCPLRGACYADVCCPHGCCSCGDKAVTLIQYSAVFADVAGHSINCLLLLCHLQLHSAVIGRN